MTADERFRVLAGMIAEIAPGLSVQEVLARAEEMTKLYRKPKVRGKAKAPRPAEGNTTETP